MAAVSELFVELFVAEPAPYVDFLQRAFDAKLTDLADTVSMLEAPGLRVLLHRGHGDLPSGHVFRAPLESGMRKGVGVEICLAVDDLEAVHKVAAGIPGFVATAIVRTPWGLRDFRLTTPDGYYLRITEPRP